MTTGRRRAWTAMGLTAVLALAAGPARASVGPIAAGPNGSAHLTWTAEAPDLLVFERTLAGDGSLGAAQIVSRAYRNTYAQVVGVDSAGTALIAWMSIDGAIDVLYTRRRGADGSLGPIQAVAPAGVDVIRFKLAVEPDGDAIYVWERVLGGRRVVQARRRAAATGAFGPIQTLSYAAAEGHSPAVAVTPAGAATVAWLREPAGGGNVTVQTRTIAPDGTVSGFQTLAPPTASVRELHVTASDTGTAVIAWSPIEGGVRVVKSRRRTAGGTLGTTQSISPPSGGTLELWTAGDAAGRTAYVWRQYDPPDFTLKGRIRQADGGLGAVFTLGGSAFAPRVALDPGGNASFAWQDMEFTSGRVLSRRRTVGGVLGPTRTISDPVDDAVDPQLAVDAAGKATLAWRVDTGGYFARTVTPSGTLSPQKRIDGD